MASELPDLAFFITYHVNSVTTAQYWKEAYACVRVFYPTSLVILIDDNSTFPVDDDFKTTNCIKVKSEHPKGKAEILPYYYFLKLKPSKKAIFLHDSVFINSKIEVKDVETYQPLWSFATAHPKNDEYGVTNFLKDMRNSSRLIDFYERVGAIGGIKGASGSMSIITWSFLSFLEEEFNLVSVSLRLINRLFDRMTLERVTGCVFAAADRPRSAFYGNMFRYCHLVSVGAEHPRRPTYLRWEDYQREKEHYKKFPVTVIFSGRSTVK